MGAIATLLGMLAHNVADTVWYRPEVNTLWWLMVALIKVIPISPLKNRPSVSLLLSPKVVISRRQAVHWELSDNKKSLK